MTDPDFEFAVNAASWPQYIDNDSKPYFLFQLLGPDGRAGEVFYREMALVGSEQIMETVVKAYMQKRKLKVFLDPAAGSHRVASVKLGTPVGP